MLWIPIFREEVLQEKIEWIKHLKIIGNKVMSEVIIIYIYI